MQKTRCIRLAKRLNNDSIIEQLYDDLLRY